MRKTFKYKAKLNSSTGRRALRLLGLCRYLYNLALEQRKLEYLNFKRHHSLTPPNLRSRRRLSTFDQSNQLPELVKAYPEFGEIPSQTRQDIIERVGKAYAKFYSKPKEEGLPRFKGKDRYHSFTLKQCGWKLEGRYLRVTGVGVFKLHLSRPIQGDIKTITVKHSNGDWYVTFSCDNVPQVLPVGPCREAVGLDMGLTNFYTDSNGRVVNNPRYLKKHSDSLARSQRELARKKRGSKNRVKTKKQLSRKHRKVTNCRRDFMFKAAKQLTHNFYTIVVEDLNIKGMVAQDKFNKSIHDVSWGEFISILIAKAEEAGRRVVKVNPKGTSQECSFCDRIVKKALSERIHRCPCGAVICRDWNAARNVLRRGGFDPPYIEDKRPGLCRSGLSVA